MSFFSELKRRNVLRVAVAYITASWVLIQIAETLFPVFGLEDSVIRAVVIVLAVGFVPAMVIAWTFELTPAGLVRDAAVDHAAPSMQAGNKRFDRIVMVVLALAVGYFAIDRLMLEPQRNLEIAEQARQEGMAESARKKRDAGPPVLAVLPFTAFSATEDSKFFAAGVHDDLLTKLARLPSMLVISRTSVLEYKDTQRNIREIGQALGADAILEGAVQSAGNQIRINVQLIDTETDEHLWAETYDRELSTANIFDVQDEITRAIAEALHGTLNAADTSSPIPTQNMAAYRAYHQAIQVRDARHGGGTTDEYRDLLQKAVELDPAFTRPMALLVGSYALAAFDSADPELIARVEQLLEGIQAAAPGSVDHLVAQTYYTYYIIKDYPLAREMANRALELAPSDAYLVEIRFWIERRMGEFDQMVESKRLAYRLEPTNPMYLVTLVNNLIIIHQYDEAWQLLEFTGLKHPGIDEWRAYLRMRQHRDPAQLAVDLKASAEQLEGENRNNALWWANIVGRDFAAAREQVEALPDPDPDDSAGISDLPFKHFGRLMADWLLQDETSLAQSVARAQKHLERLGESASNADLSFALIAAASGDRAETIRRLEYWQRVVAAEDIAARLMNSDILCVIYAMARADEEAVQCIRDAMNSPSRVLPFMEIHLPFYDAMRDTPSFQQLVAEVESTYSDPIKFINSGGSSDRSSKLLPGPTRSITR